MKKNDASDDIKAFAIGLVGTKTEAEERERKPSAKQFALQIGIYAGLVVCYFFLVLTLLWTWLKDLFDQNRLIYPAVALALIAGQGVVLEVVAVAIHRVIKSKID